MFLSSFLFARFVLPSMRSDARIARFVRHAVLIVETLIGKSSRELLIALTVAAARSERCFQTGLMRRVRAIENVEGNVRGAPCRPRRLRWSALARRRFRRRRALLRFVMQTRGQLFRGAFDRVFCRFEWALGCPSCHEILRHDFIANSARTHRGARDVTHRVILSEAKDLNTRNLRSFAVFAAQDDTRGDPSPSS